MTFTEDEHSFTLKTTQLKSEDELSKGLWLLLVGIHETPPHIALISEGKYYSVSVKKVENGTPAKSFVSAVKRKQIPAVFIEITSPQTPKGALNSATQSPFRGLGRNESKTINLLSSIYSDIQPLCITDETCLSPIKSFFTQYFSDEFNDVNYVFELLAIVEKRGMLGDCQSLNNEIPNSNSITLPKYSMAQIRKRINHFSTPITSTK